MYKVGELTVYPAQGVTRIERIEKRNVSGNQRTFYVLKVLGNHTTIMVPKDNVSSVGLRRLMSPEIMKKVYRILGEKKKKLNGQSWRERNKEYMKKIRSGTPFELAEVMRDLCIIKGDKTLSFGERRILDTVKGILTKEMALVKKVPEREIEQEIEGIL